MKYLQLTLLFLTVSLTVSAQQGRGDIRQGNRLFKDEKFDEAEQAYRKALGENAPNRVAGFNLGDALYRQEKFEEAGRQFEAAASSNLNKGSASHAYHNLGNSLLQAGNIDESIEAYKEALRRNPSDLDTKYNLSYAKMLKKKQEQQQQQNQQQEQNQEKQDQKKQDQNQDNQNQDNQQQDQKNQENQQQGKENQPSNPQQSKEQEVKISPEDAKRLLEALANDEKKVQDKVKKEKAKANRVRTIKDW
jgi:tetratricopeptide (TPR) repeat protein